jgi:DNA-binding transcriptional regulator YdaS (Cro superfamily)
MDDINALLDKAIELCGGTRPKLEARMGVARNTIYRALEKARKTGALDSDLAVRIERATNGAVPAYLTCPSLPWPHAPKEPAEPSLTHDTNPCREGC